MPITILMLLQDFGSVQLLEGKAHRHRKAMFRNIGTDGAAQRLADEFQRAWNQTLPRLQRANRIILFHEMEALLTRVGAAWAGIPLTDEEARQRTREYSEMLAATGTVGPRTLRALWLRQRTERWARRVIKQARAGQLKPLIDSALHIVAYHRDLEGKLLTPKIAAVELLNVLRAIVAVARFIVFAGDEQYGQFVASTAFADVPIVWLDVALLTRLMTAHSTRTIKQGDVTDIDAMATYLPYCDVYGADRFMAEVARSLKVPKRYNCHVFDSRKDEVAKLIDHLRIALAGIPPVWAVHLRCGGRRHQGELVLVLPQDRKPGEDGGEPLRRVDRAVRF